MFRSIVKRGVLVMAVAALLTVPASSFAAVFKLKAVMAGTELDPGASGNATWEFDTSNNRMRLSVEGEDITLGESVFVFVNWRFIGEATLVNGFFDINLDTQDGDIVPRVKNGHNVSILSNACWLVLEGAFAIDR
jgi:hypothetical protein